MRKMIILVIVMILLFIGLSYISYQVIEKKQEKNQNDGREYNDDDRL